jgi:hypothetical protein
MKALTPNPLSSSQGAHAGRGGTVLWIFFLAALILTFGLKAAQLGWFDSRPPLALDGEPGLLFFNKARGCECELLVYNNANAQMETWNASNRLIRIDIERRPDLARHYEVIRAPTLVLLNAEGQVVWRQDEGLSDESPLDLNQAERQIEAMTDGNLP